MKLQGAITALVTPFTRNGGVNYDKLAELIEFQIENGAAGIVLLGTTGEAPTIRPDEAEQTPVLSASRHLVEKMIGRLMEGLVTPVSLLSVVDDLMGQDDGVQSGYKG